MRKPRDFLVVFGKGLAMREKTGAMPQGNSWFEADGAEAARRNKEKTTRNQYFLSLAVLKEQLVRRFNRFPETLPP